MSSKHRAISVALGADHLPSSNLKAETERPRCVQGASRTTTSTSSSMLQASSSEIPVAVFVASEADQPYRSSNLDVLTPNSDYLRPLPSQSEGPAPATIATWLILPVVIPTTATHPGRDSETEYHRVPRLLGPGRRAIR